MSLILPAGNEYALHERLVESGADVLTPEQAAHQDIREIRIAFLNLMPSTTFEDTEVDWLHFMSRSSGIQVEPILFGFDDDPRRQTGASRADMLQHYATFSEVANGTVDGLIITGGNLELRCDAKDGPPEPLPFDEVRFSKQLGEVIDWAQANVYSTLYSCFAGHFALHHLFEVEREVGDAKLFGVFEHDVDHNIPSALTAGMDDVFRAPHARWGNVPESSLVDVPVEVLATNKTAGWLLAQFANDAEGMSFALQGHPEYRRNALMYEHQRDGGFEVHDLPGYYSADRQPKLTWANDAQVLFGNWLRYIYGGIQPVQK